MLRSCWLAADQELPGATANNISSGSTNWTQQRDKGGSKIPVEEPLKKRIKSTTGHNNTPAKRYHWQFKISADPRMTYTYSSTRQEQVTAPMHVCTKHVGKGPLARRIRSRNETGRLQRDCGLVAPKNCYYCEQHKQRIKAQDTTLKCHFNADTWMAKIADPRMTYTYSSKQEQGTAP